MRKLLLFALALLTLAVMASACALADTPAPAIDPGRNQLDFQATARAFTATAQVERDATQAAEQRQAAQAATATAAVVQATAQAATATSRAATMAAQTLEARGTLQAWQMQADGATQSARRTEQADNRTATADADQAAINDAQVQAQKTAVAAQAETARLAAERERQWNGVRGAAPWILLFTVVPLLAYLAYLYGERHSRRLEYHDNPNGVQIGRNHTYQPSRDPGAGTQVVNGQWRALDLAPLPVQAAVTLNAQALASGRKVEPAIVRGPEDTQPVRVGRNLPAVAAPWDLFPQAGPIPLGVDERGQIILPDFEAWPHRLVAGRTGSGKSESAIVPFVAGALRRGWPVISLGMMPTPALKVFLGHENYYNIVIPEPSRVLDYMAAINAEARRRWDMVTAAPADVKSWSGMPANAGPRVAVVIDEFTVLYGMLEAAERRKFNGLLSGLVFLGRTSGVHLVLNVHNPTQENVNTNVRRQSLVCCFSVGDSTASRVVLEQAGAELLPLKTGRFLVRMESVRAGVAFHPSPEEVKGYLAGSENQRFELPWLSGLGAARPAETIQADDTEQRIIDMAAAGMSRSAIAKELFGSPGGTGYYRVKAVLDGTSTGTSSEEGVEEGA